MNKTWKPLTPKEKSLLTPKEKRAHRAEYNRRYNVWKYLNETFQPRSEQLNPYTTNGVLYPNVGIEIVFKELSSDVKEKLDEIMIDFPEYRSEIQLNKYSGINTVFAVYER